MKKISLYLKAVLISGVLFAAIVVSIVVFVNSNKVQDTMIQIQNDYVLKSIDGYIGHIVDEYTTLSETFFNNSIILDILKNKDIKEFYNEMIPMSEKFRDAESFLFGLQVVLADGESFFQVNSNDNKEFYVEDTKVLINKTIMTQSLQSGFESSKYGNHFKMAYPIFHYDGELLGVIEFSFNIEKILQDIKKHFGYEMALIHKDKNYNIQVATSQLIEQFLSKIDMRHSSNTIFDYGEQTYELSIFDAINKTSSFKFAALYDVTALVDQRKDTQYSVMSVLLVISLMTILFVVFLIDYFLKNIREKELESLAKSEELYFKARHNHITQLPNTHVMSEEISLLKHYSVIMLNVDNISIYNTTFGSDTVDLLLKECAHYIDDNMPSNGVLYHLSADEFTIVLSNPIENQEFMLASQIKAYFEQVPLRANNTQLHINFSFGIAIHNQEEKNRLNTFSKANIALLEAKIRGKGVILVYDESMSGYGSYTQLANNIATLQRDLENGNLTPFYQPIVDTITKKIVKYEVLARIKDNAKYISPYEFMRAAEVSGLQTALTKQMIQKSFKYFAGSSTAFSINITKYDLLEGYLIRFLKQKTTMYHIDASNVSLEILEDIAIESDAEIVKQINLLAKEGYIIAIDDFGVESSNISKLADLNASYIKIDGSFIKDMDVNETHLKIVESLVYMAKKLDLEIVAEFVHNEAIYNIVKDLGIKYSQGYYFSEPKIVI